jgi:PAS domain S-box-containing protein
MLRSMATPNFKKFFENSVDMMMVANSNGDVVATNDACTVALGWSQDEWLNQEFVKLSHPDDVADLLGASTKLRHGSADSKSETRFRHRDGTYRWVDWVAWSSAGMTNIIARDVTLRKNADEALRESEATTRSILNSVNSAIMTIDGDGLIEEFNPSAEKLFGYPRTEVMGENVSKLMPESEQSAHDAYLKHYKETGESRIIGINREVLGRRKDGTEFLLDLEVSAVEFESRRLFTGVARDVTKLQATRLALEEAKSVAVQANDAKSAFLSRMSHELRTPLNAILGFAQLMKVNATSDEHDESATMIIKAGRHLLSLVNEVLDISRVESGQLSISPEAVGLAEVLQDSLSLVEPQANLRRIKFANRSRANLVVRADRQRLKQVLLNLLANAVKYSYEDGLVTIEAKPTIDGNIRISITDEGPGIQSEAIDKLFKPFERLGADTSDVEGTGLGLALSSGLVEAMGGTIGVESNYGQGSKFWFELFAIDTPLDKIAELNEREYLSISSIDVKGTLLYIEDNESNQRLMERAISLRPGVTLITASDGATGLELARESEPDVIFLDLHLPDVSGREVLRLLRTDRLTCNIPVVIVSADASPGQIKRIRTEGAYAYLTKPIEFEQMFGLLDEIMVVPAID